MSKLKVVVRKILFYSFTFELSRAKYHKYNIYLTELTNERKNENVVIN